MSVEMSLADERWIVVADSPFLPAHGGGEVEHLGFVRSCVEAGVLAALVVPADADAAAAGRQDDIEGLRRLIHPAPLLLTPRIRGAGAVGWGRRPYSVASRPVPSGLARDVRAVAGRATGVVCYSYKSHRLAEHVAEAMGLPGVVRMHNLEGRYLRALADARPEMVKWAVRAEAARLSADERRLEGAPWVRGIADISRSDAAERQARTSTPVVYLPSFAVAGTAQRGEATWSLVRDADVVFLGALDVTTNHEALAWFCRDVWPRVVDRIPKARLRVVGRRPSDQVRSLICSVTGAELHADVPDPADYLCSSRVAVNPAVSGSGVNIKLVEYLASGVPVVSTPLGAQGLGIVDYVDALIRHDAAGFADGVVNLIEDDDLAVRVGERGRALAAGLRDARPGLETIARLLHEPRR